MARGFSVSGDHLGQTSHGLRWPFGPVGLITPFNFPLEIPVLYMGNKPLLHVDHRVCIVIEQYVRLLHECGMPKTDVDMLHGPGTTMGHVLHEAKPRSTLFTGARAAVLSCTSCAVVLLCNALPLQSGSVHKHLQAAATVALRC
jgi:1-pyrroline-5-carboxylate dehydrogenase